MKNNILYNEKRKIMLFFISLVLPLVLCGCNTMEGAGEDIQHAGKALERSAARNKGCPPPCSH
jgi:predicted small secreted protein